MQATRAFDPAIRWGVLALLVLGAASAARAQDGGRARHEPPAAAAAQAAPDAKPSLEIYGFAMIDIGQNFKQIDPSWFDTMRVTKLPSFNEQYGKDNSTFAGVRQSRLGFRTSSATGLG